VAQPFDVEATQSGIMKVAVLRHQYFQMDGLSRYDGVLCSCVAEKLGMLLGVEKNKGVCS
jgi:hypothetical protein